MKRKIESDKNELDGYIIGMYGYRSMRYMLLSKNIKDHGGIVYDKCQLDGIKLSHLVIEKGSDIEKGIKEYKPMIQEDTKIVSSAWLDKISVAHHKVDEASYIISTTYKDKDTVATHTDSPSTSIPISKCTIDYLSLCPSLEPPRNHNGWSLVCDEALGVYMNKDCKGTDKIAAFDMDSTLIKTESGKRFAVNDKDWELFDKNIPSILDRYYNDGYNIIILSNQGGIRKKKTTHEEIQKKINDIMKVCKVPMQVLYAVNDDVFRKPRGGMWQYAVKYLNDGVCIKPSQCVYVGDAAGRPKEGTYKKDYAASDYEMALNVNIPFQTPEQVWFNSKQQLHTDRKKCIHNKWNFDPTKLLLENDKNLSVVQGVINDINVIKGDSIILIMLVGGPGSGKSTFSKKYFPSFERINQDTLKSKEKCVSIAKRYLQDGKSVIIDNTNKTIENRNTWIQVARSFKINIICIHITTPPELCFHLNKLRALTSKDDPRQVPDVVINSYFSGFSPPSIKDGYDHIYKVPFVVDTDNVSPLLTTWL